MKSFVVYGNTDREIRFVWHVNATEEGVSYFNQQPGHFSRKEKAYALPLH